MSLEALQKEIEKKGKEDARKLEDEARARAEQIISDAKKRIKDIEAYEQSSLKDEIRRLENEYLASSELSRNTLLLEAREQVVNEVYARLRRELVKDLRERQKQIFDKAKKMAKDMEGMQHVRFVINKKDAALLKGVIGKIDYQDLSGGLIVVSEDGSIKIDASIDSLLDNSADAIKSVITSALFGARVPRKSGERKTSKAKSTKTRKQKPKSKKMAKKAATGKKKRRK